MSRATTFLSSLAAAFLAIAPQAFDKGDRRGFDENWQDVASGALAGKLDHADDVQSVVLSPDGSALAFGATRW